ncbi:hypothetical protein [Paenibacillus alkalitolerans]|uniref:hypothetical protein n=1 Tax=Paenibacillus alkalitolerans TaxID=2799335 RepID=UPI0018F64B7B|nr:hypothetical protein [Paenibacillus alkalitolerans]
MTNGNVAVAFGLAGGDGIVEARWAEGERDIAFFLEGGGSLLPAGVQESTVSENGVYTIYVKDAAGNLMVERVDIRTIIRTPPAVSLAPDVTVPTNRAVNVKVTAEVAGGEAGNSVTVLKWAEGSRTADYFAGAGTAIGLDNRSFAVTRNGAYTVYAKDAAGNESVAAIEVRNIFTVAPVLTLKATPLHPTGNDVTVQAYYKIDGESDGNSLAVMKWAAGNRTADDFDTTGTILSAADPSFKVIANGAYSVYIRDAADNETVKTIAIDNIRGRGNEHRNDNGLNKGK